jgi:hypothetical protein
MRPLISASPHRGHACESGFRSSRAPLAIQRQRELGRQYMSYMSLSHLKDRCAGCNRSNVPMNKEHVFPQWLISRTGTHATGIRWGGKRGVSALAATFPLCTECNSAFGRELESPTSILFHEIETGKGFSDLEAELLIRWLWKIDGLLWIAAHPSGTYTDKYSLRERVLRPLDEIRKHLILAIALIQSIDPSYNDTPMGIDSDTQHDAIFVSGVFSKIAVMVVLSTFEDMIPSPFCKFRLADRRNALSSAKLFYPKVGFANDTDAVGVTVFASIRLSKAHDAYALRLRSGNSARGAG